MCFSGDMDQPDCLMKLNSALERRWDVLVKGLPIYAITGTADAYTRYKEDKIH